MKKEEIISRLTSKGAFSREDLVIVYDTNKPLSLNDFLLSMRDDSSRLFIDEKGNIYCRKDGSILVINKTGNIKMLSFDMESFNLRYYKIMSISEANHYYEKATNLNVVPILNEDVIKELNKGSRLLFSIEDVSGELVLVKNYLSIAMDSDDFKEESLPGVILTALLKGNWEKIVG